MAKKTFAHPTWCIFAEKFIWGLEKSGYACQGAILKFQSQAFCILSLLHFIDGRCSLALIIPKYIRKLLRFIHIDCHLAVSRRFIGEAKQTVCGDISQALGAASVPRGSPLFPEND